MPNIARYYYLAYLKFNAIGTQYVVYVAEGHCINLICKVRTYIYKYGLPFHKTNEQKLGQFHFLEEEEAKGRSIFLTSIFWIAIQKTNQNSSFDNLVNIQILTLCLSRSFDIAFRWLNSV